MAQPFLDLRDVCPVFEGVGCRRGAKGVGSEGFHGNADGLGVVHHDVPVDRVAGEGLFEVPVGATDRSEEGSLGVIPVSGGIEVVLDEAKGPRVDGRVAELPALSMHGECHDAPALDKVLHLEGAEFRSAQAVVEKDGEDGSVAFPLEGRRVRSVEELAGLVVGNRRGLAFVGPFGGPLHAVDRVDGDGVLLAEVIEEVGERGELPANRRRGEGLLFEGFPPGDDVGSIHHPELGELLDADELHELADVVPVGASRVGVRDVREPLRLGRNVGEPLKLSPGEHPFLGCLRR